MKLIAGIVLAAAALAGCRAASEETVKFVGVSMSPTIKDGDIIRVARFDRGAKFDLKRGDVILFLYPSEPSKSYVKRLVGMPGDSVEVRAGKVFVNGEELAEPYVDPSLNEFDESHPPVRVGERSYYVLGDNRDNSSDSRAWGPVPEKYVLGKVLNR